MMIVNSAAKQELLSNGYSLKEVSKCPKCGEEVEVLQKETGRVVRVNSLKHEERPGMLHDFGCRVKQE